MKKNGIILIARELWQRINRWIITHVGKDGIMVTNQWVGNYYLQADGTMTTDKWIGKYYIDSNGYCIN